MPTLVLMHHGESGLAARSHTRPLTPRGREEAASQARAVARVIGGISVAIVSEATCTRQILIALRSAGLAVARVWEEVNLYSHEEENLLETLRGLDHCGTKDSVRESADAGGGVKAEAAPVIEHKPTVPTLTGLLATRENDLPESRGRVPFRTLRGSDVTRVSSFRYGFSTAMTAVGHVKSWSSLAPGHMQIVDVPCP